MSYKDQAFLLLLNDGRPGHYRQVQALAHYLSQDLPLQTHTLTFQLKSPWRQSAPRLLPFGLSAHPNIRRGLPSAPPVTIIGCGRRAALVSRWLSNYWSDHTVKTIQILDSGLPSHYFDQVIAPRHDRLSGDNVIHVTGSLNPVDESWMNQAQSRYSLPAVYAQGSVVLLLGGASQRFSFSRSWFEAELSELIPGLTAQSYPLVVLMSPRTPEWVVDVLHQQLSSLPYHLITWPARPYAYAASLASARQVLVTPDSVNLISEAVARGAPIYVLDAPLTGRKTKKLKTFILALQSDGLVRPASEFPEANAVSVPAKQETRAVARQLIASGLFDGI